MFRWKIEGQGGELMKGRDVYHRLEHETERSEQVNECLVGGFDGTRVKRG